MVVLGVIAEIGGKAKLADVRGRSSAPGAGLLQERRGTLEAVEISGRKKVGARIILFFQHVATCFLRLSKWWTIVVKRSSAYV